MLVEADDGGVTNTPLAKWMTKHGHVVKIPLTPEMRMMAYETFRILDLDGSGEMDEHELQNAFEGLGVKLSLQEVSKMAKEVDNDGSGMLGPEEFLQLLHMHPDLFGHDSNSLQTMASAHRRAENISKLINKPPGKSIHESEFKLPPVTDLPGRRMPRKRPTAVQPAEEKTWDEINGGSVIPTKSLASFFRQSTEKGMDSDDSFLAGAGRKGSDYSAGGSLFHSRVGRARAVSQAMNMAKELRALGIPCEDDLSPVRPELLHESSSGVGASPELLHGVRRKKKIFDAREDIRRYAAPVTDPEGDGVLFLSPGVRGKRASMRGTKLTNISPAKKEVIARNGGKSIRMRTIVDDWTPLSRSC